MKRIMLVVTDHRERRDYYNALQKDRIVNGTLESGEQALKLLERGVQADLILVSLEPVEGSTAIDVIEFLRLVHANSLCPSAVFVIVEKGVRVVITKTIADGFEVTFVPKEASKVRVVVDRLLSDQLLTAGRQSK